MLRQACLLCAILSFTACTSEKSTRPVRYGNMKKGDFVSEDIWFRVVQIVTNNDDLKEYTASKVYALLQLPDAHENGIKVGGYILGEYGNLLKNVTGQQIFDTLHKRFLVVSLQVGVSL